jgi:Na+/melibiose symporter-like transporter
VEIFCFILTIIFILKTLLTKTDGKSQAEQGIITFKKILAAHSFTWVGIQTMFIYMTPYVLYKVFNVTDRTLVTEQMNNEIGRTVSISFLILNAVAAVLPAVALEPITRKIGKVRTHFLCIASMAISYGLLLSLGYSATVIYVIMALLGIGWAATISLPFAIMSQEIDQARMGLFMGLFNLSVVLPQLVSSGIGRMLEAASDKSIIFIISTVTLGLSAVLWLLVKERNIPTENPEILSSSH